MIRLVASDLDGTLMHQHNEISDYSKMVLNQIMGEGIYFVPCSARSWKEMPEWLKENKRIHYIVCDNGAIIMDNQKEKSLVENKMSCEKAKEIIQALEGVNEYWTMDIDGVSYSSSKIIDNLAILAVDEAHLKWIMDNRTFVDDYVELLSRTDGLAKIHYMVPNAELKEKTKEVLSQIMEIEISSSHVRNLEIMHPKATKGNALAFIGNRLGISPLEMMAFGDNNNDLSMLKYVGFAYVPSNATDELKAEIQELSGSNSEDIVGKRIAEILG